MRLYSQSLMDISFKIANNKGDQILVALSYYDTEVYDAEVWNHPRQLHEEKNEKLGYDHTREHRERIDRGICHGGIVARYSVRHIGERHRVSH